MKINVEIIGESGEVAEFTERLRKLMRDFGSISSEDTARTGCLAKVSVEVERHPYPYVEVSVINPRRDVEAFRAI